MFFLRYLRDLRKSVETGRGAADIKPRVSNVRAASKGVRRASPHSATTVEIVSATRDDKEAFWTRAPLGLSLRRLESDQRLSHSIVFENQTGLGEFYNLRINASSADILVFVHDDVWIDDFFLTDRVAHGLDHFDVIGVAGNQRRVPRQPSWAFTVYDSTGNFAWDDPINLSGGIAHGMVPSGSVGYYGAMPVACELLDGVLLATRRSTLVKAGVYFDPIFRFNFYDMDFCRAARSKNLRLGTWQIAITHQSGGDGAGGFGSIEWQNAFSSYLKKWQT